MRIPRRLKLAGLLISGAWIPVTVTCQPQDAVINIVPSGGYSVDESYDYYEVDDGWHWFDFSFWHDHHDHDD